MIRWNGWGYTNIVLELPLTAEKLLGELCAPGRPTIDISWEQIEKNIPQSKIKKSNPLISTEPKLRFNHSHGQSFADWVNMRFGKLGHMVDAVAFPQTEQNLMELIDLGQKNDWIMIPYGGGSSVVGHLTPLNQSKPILSISLSRLNKLLDINKENHIALFEAGVLGPDLEAQLQAHGYTLGHYPQSFELSTLGGWIVTRSSGQQSRYYGRMDQNFLGGRLLLPRKIYDIPAIPASSAGPDIKQLIAGSEGRMGILSQAKIRIHPLPQEDRVYVFFLAGREKGIAAVKALGQSDLPLSMVRLSNESETITQLQLAGKEKLISWLYRYLAWRGINKEDACMCMVGLTGDSSVVRAGLRKAKQLLKPFHAITIGRLMEKKWKAKRFLSAYMRNTLWEKGYGVDTLETALLWDKIPQAMEDVESAIQDAVDWPVHVFTHLSHVYKTGSSLYTTYVFPLASDAKTNLDLWLKMKTAASKEIVRHGGTISHQHGVGKDHAPYLEAEKGELGMDILKQVFATTDPQQRFNPGNLIYQDKEGES